MLRTTLHKTNTSILGRRFASGLNSDGPLPERPLKKIRVGKARPAIYYKFNCKVENSDGSVVIRRTVFPSDEFRLIQDQRNSPLWNPNRSDLEAIDINAGGKMKKFRQKFSSFSVIEENPVDNPIESGKEAENESKEESKEEAQGESLLLDDYLDILGQNVQEVQKNGKLATKQGRSKKK